MIGVLVLCTVFAIVCRLYFKKRYIDYKQALEDDGK